MEVTEVRTSTITSKGQIVIPSGVRSQNGFRAGQKVMVVAYKDRIEVMPFREFEKTEYFEKRRKETRAALKKFVDKHGLRGKRIKELTRKEKDELAMSLP